MSNFPEIEAMCSKRNIIAAINMGLRAKDSVTPEFLPELLARIEALEDRLIALAGIRIVERSNGKFGVICGNILRTVKATRKGARGAALRIAEAN